MSFRTWLGRIGAAFGIALAGSCASAPPAPELATVVAPEPVPLPSPGPALWKVEDEDTTIYLFGTIHALPADAEWFDARIQRAFAASDELVTEIDMAAQNETASRMSQAGALVPGRNLRQMMTPENRSEYEAALASVGVPPGELDQVEPWYAALNLTMLPLLQSGFDLSAGVDQVLSERAAAKRRTALETVEEQVALFDGLPIAAQLSLLDSAAEGMGGTVATLNAMVEAWLEGDADQLGELMNADMDDPILHARLLTDRNAHWADWVERRLAQPGTVFMAVGAGHLAGDGSVQHMLEARGHRVDRIWQ